MKGSVCFLFGTLAVLSVAAHGEDIKEWQVAQCAYGPVLMTRSMNASNESRETRGRIADNWHQIQAIRGRHPESKSGFFRSQYLTRDEEAETSRIYRQIDIQQFYAVAESQRARDADVTVDMMVAAAAIRDGARSPPAGTPESRPYEYLSALMNALSRSHAPDHPDHFSPTHCSVDLALQIESGARRVKEGHNLMGMPEHLQLLGWRAKYGFPEGAPFDGVKLSADAARQLEFEAIFRARVERLRAYGAAVGAIRFFAKMSDIRYDALKAEALLPLNSNTLAEFLRLRAERRAKLPEHMQAVWDFWDFIDQQVPSEGGGSPTSCFFP